MNKIRTEFDYVLNYITLVSHDGKRHNFYPQFVELVYQESIFTPCIHASLLVADSVDFPTLLPILGEERLLVSFTRQDETSKEGSLLDPLVINLASYSIVGRTQDAGSKKRQTYQLDLVSDELFKNISTRIFTKYKNRTYSSMVKKIFNEHLKIKKPLKVVEETSGTYTYLFQNQSPIRCIEILKNKSISSEKNGYCYVFYEDRDQFNFITITKLLQQNPIAAYTYEPKNVSDQSEGLQTKNIRTQGLYAVEFYENSSSVNTMSSALSREGTSSLLTVDPIRRRYSLNAFDLRGDEGKKLHKIPLVDNSSWDSVPRMEKGKPWINNSRMFSHPLSNMSMLITDSGQDTQEYISERDIETKPFNPETFYLQRESHILQLTKNVMKVSLSGDPRIKAGCVVLFYLPENLGKTDKQNPEEFDKYLQGRYLVAGVQHILKKGSYRMELELIKDTFFSDIKSRDPAKEYLNTY
ncbi:hypothetical protein UFOVP410_112 [uncultured Caudovirales phage]|uniref:Uncharacterized protein n=1 Tax=uncultured Caudovirales phage TaxID=2100421 RepID=A0A6J5M7A6_9CAUD|nr:hypothetical protein UFOVP410_112 [uncultured Caudovirales phage]